MNNQTPFNNYFEAKKAIQVITDRTSMFAFSKKIMLTMKHSDETDRMRGFETEAIDELLEMMDQHCISNNIDQTLVV